MDLTDKQKAFCKEFLKDFNATQAATRAGYSEKTARQIGSDLLSKVDIQNQIQSMSNKVNAKTDNEIERIITELQLIAFGSLVDVAEWNAWGLKLKESGELGDKARIVSEVAESKSENGSTLKIKLYDKLRALEMLGRYHKIFTDKQENTSVSMSYEEYLKSLNEKK